MTKYLNENKLSIFLIIFVVFIFSFLSYYKALRYDFWRDDWVLIWQSLYDRTDFLKWVLRIRHPGEIFNTYLLSPIFQTNILVWQAFGLLLKFFASICIGLGLYGISKSKKAAIYAVLISSSSFLGLEGFTWISARLNAFILIIASLSVFFYGLSYGNTKYRNNFLIASYLLIILAMFMEPARAIFIPALLSMWEFVQRFVSRLNGYFTWIIRSIGLLFSLLAGASLTNYGRELVYGGGSGGPISSIFEDKNLIYNFFNSISNIILVYFNGVREYAGSLTHFSKQDAYIGVISITILVLVSLYLFFKKKQVAPIFILSWFWIIIFFAPGWISDPIISPGLSSRFFTISLAGFAWLLAIFLQNINYKPTMFIIILVVITNLYFSNRILAINAAYIDTRVTRPLYNAQANTVTKNTDPKLFVVTGDHFLRGYVFDWATNGAVPYAFINNISNFDEVPLFGVNYQLAGELVCNEGTSRPSLSEWVVQKNRIDIKNIYGWDLNTSADLNETVNKTRIKVAHESDCLIKELGTNITHDLIISSYFLLEDVYQEENKKIASLMFKASGPVHESIDIMLLSKNRLIVSTNRLLSSDRLQDSFIVEEFVDEEPDTLIMNHEGARYYFEL